MLCLHWQQNTQCSVGWMQDKMRWKHTIELYINWKYPQVIRVKVPWVHAYRTTTQDWFAKDPLNDSRAWVKFLDKFWDGLPRPDLKLSRLSRLWMRVTQAKEHPQKVGICYRFVPFSSVPERRGSKEDHFSWITVSTRRVCNATGRIQRWTQQEKTDTLK